MTETLIPLFIALAGSEQPARRVWRIFINPFTQRAYPLSLASRQVSLTIEGISQNGIKPHLTGVAQVKVGGDADSVRRAARRFLNQQDAIDHYTQETLSGSLRSLVGTLTVESIIKDRASFAKSVKEEVERSMHNQGLVIDTFQIQSVDDFSGYLDNLGRPEAALAEKRAKIAEAQPLQVAEQAKAIADEQVAAPMSAIKNMTALLQGMAGTRAPAGAADRAPKPVLKTEPNHMAGTLTRSSSWRCRPVATGHPPPCHRQSGRQAALVIAGIRE